MRRERKIERAVQRLEREALRASSARTRDVRTSVFALLEAGKLTQAAKEVEELARVAIEAAGVDAIRKRLNERRDAEVGPVRALEGTAPFDARKARKVLAASLKGWGAGGQLFDGGGVALRYTDMNALAKDLRHVRGSTLEKARAPVRGRPVALQIKAPRGEPAVFVLPKLPLERILDVTLEVVLAKAPSGSTQVAILVGTDADVARGGGFTFGVVPVQVLNSKLASQSSVAIPPIPDLVPMRLRVELPDDGDRARARGMLSLPSTEHRASGSLTVSTRGAVAIYVEDAEVWITSLEVRGLLDASSLR